ncbi:MAG TPA: UxaA family hydrolase, partial [Candidatus Acidoferrales bacterium]|nr:UxaA family hydrolase [Candidatus Acidoferrales bacterium]
MRSSVLKVDSRDNVLIALSDLRKGQQIQFNGDVYELTTDVAAKHKFATADLAAGGKVIMYGVLVGEAMKPIRRGEAITTANLHHQSAPFHDKTRQLSWSPPDVSRWRTRNFMGYRRADGQAGTRNYWLVVPLVFCENRNIAVLKQ